MFKFKFLILLFIIFFNSMSFASDLIQTNPTHQPTFTFDQKVEQSNANNQPIFREGSSIYGPELVTNGDFSAGTLNWASDHPSIISAEGGRLNINRNGAGPVGQCYQTVATEVGKTYLIELDLISTTAGFSIYKDKDVGQTIYDSGGSNPSQSGIISGTFVADGTTTTISFGGTWNTTTIAVVKKISIKEINEELITNSDFSAANTSNWTLNTGWVITNEQAVYDGSGGTSFIIGESIAWTNGTLYELVIDIAYNEGDGFNSVFFGNGNNVYSKHLSAGIHTIRGIKGGNDNKLFITGRTSETLIINSISLKKINLNNSQNKINFDNNDYLIGLPAQSGDFTYLIEGIDIPNHSSINLRIIGELSTYSARVISLAGKLRVLDDQNRTLFDETWDGQGDLLVKVENNILQVYQNGAQLGSDKDVSNSTFNTINTIGNSGSSLNGSIKSLQIYDQAVEDVNNIVEKPVFELKANPLTMLNSNGQQVTNGEKVETWCDNISLGLVKFDDNDFITGLPPLSGDFTYLIKGLNMEDLGPINRMFLSNNSTHSIFFLYGNNSSKSFALRGENNVIYLFNKLGTYDKKIDLALVRDSNNLNYKLYVDGVLSGSITASTDWEFDLNTLGRHFTSINASLQSLEIYDQAVEDLNNITETPIFVLDASSNYHAAQIGEKISLWSSVNIQDTYDNIYQVAKNSNSDPLIYGEFDTETVQINGEFNVTGNSQISGQLNVNNNAQIDGQLIVSSKAQIDGELRVANGIRTNEVNVQLQSAWPDYVFADDYQLPTIMEMSKHIKEHKHLPGVPSAADIAKDGLDMAKIMTAQMEKIEELSLYIIELEKKNQLLKKENHSIKNDLIPSILKRLQNLENK